MKKNRQKISVITPTFNRLHNVADSIDSSLRILESNQFDEILVIDDCSTDGTFEFLSFKYRDYINDGRISIFSNKENIGATASKNLGARLARGEWLLFMDSDDQFTSDAGVTINNLIDSYSSIDFFFLRCVDKRGNLIGSSPVERLITLNVILNEGLSGECLPLIKREVMLLHPYNDFLRGCETTAYYSMLNSGYRCFQSDKVARICETNSGDRLSNRINVLKRSDRLAIYYKQKIKFFKQLTLKQSIVTALKFSVYFCISIMVSKK